MKRIAISIAALLLASCESVPIAASYTGAAAGHAYTAAYTTTGGVAVAVSAK